LKKIILKKVELFEHDERWWRYEEEEDGRWWKVKKKLGADDSLLNKMDMQSDG